jgi:hypothetical protein
MRFAKLLSEKNYTVENFVTDIKPIEIAIPIENLHYVTIEQVLGTKQKTDLHVKQLGKVKKKIKSEVIGIKRNSAVRT